MKLLVTGATGMLGLATYRAAVDAGHQVLGLGRTELDITCKQALRANLRGFDVVINCAGLTKHREVEPTAAEYNRVNTYGPLLLAAECDEIGARLVHVSTDCVFSGQRPVEDGPYTEADLPDALDNYGISKWMGEVTSAPHLTVRCSFVGNGDRGLIAWLRQAAVNMLDAPHERGETVTIVPVELYSEAYWSGSTAPAIARALVELAGKRDVTGVMHLTRGLRYSKADLIEAMWDTGCAREVPHIERDEPRINRWLDTTRDDVPALPPLYDALKELRS